MRTTFKGIATFFLSVFVILIIHLNIKQYYQPKFLYSNNHIFNQDVINQLYYLKSKIHAGEAVKMQEIFPEGFVFFNVIYGLTWCEIAEKSKPKTEVFKEAISEIDWTIKEVNSANGRESFDESLPLAYGAFYQGWTTLLLGKKLSIINKNERNIANIDDFQWKCDLIAAALTENRFSYLASYQTGTWQADNVICIASLALHDKLFVPKYRHIIAEWIEKVKTDLDPKTGLISHSDEERKPRGSSQSLMNVFLPEIDSVFANEIFKKYKNNFLENRLGLVAICEYPKGVEGVGDIDSGPVIWDVGGVASIVGIKAMAVNKDFAIAKSLRNNIEGLSFPIDINDNKKYFFGTFPMADAFIAWANVTEIDEENIQKEANRKMIFHLISTCLIFFITTILYLFWKRKV